MKKLIAIILLTLISAAIFADGKVISVTMNPPNPNFGDQVQITVSYCAQLYNSEFIAVAISSSPTKSSADLSNNGQIFVVSVAGVDAATSLPDGGNAGGPIGWIANSNPNGGTPTCTDCATQNGKLFTNVYTVHIPPATDFPGCNLSQLYIHVALKDANMNAPDWLSAGDTGACSSEPAPVSWTMGTQAKGFTMSKTTSGEVQAAGDLVLYSINYTYWNGTLTLTDTIPSSPGNDLKLVAFGPTGMSGGSVTGPSIGATSGNFTWALPDRTGMPGSASGTVWMLYQETQNPPTMGTNYANSATGTMAGVANQNASADCIVGQAAISIAASQSAPNPNYGDVVTYYLTYNVNGMQLAAFQSFDDLAMGVYGSPNSLAGSPPTGWQFAPQNGANGQWTISDACNTGDRVITGMVTTVSTYPGLLYQGVSGNALCSGIVYGEANINPETNEGADALMYFRNDGNVGGKAYALIISVDKNIGGYTGGHIDFQACTPSCIYPTPTIIGLDPQITANQWWAIKVLVDPANQYHFQAKAWQRGSPEPVGYQIDWTDPNGAAEGMDCNNGTSWKAGFGEEGGDGSSPYVQDSYNNFQVFNPRVAANAVVWDTIPNAVAGTSDGSITYIGQQGPYPYSGNAQVAKWNLGTVSNEGGTFTWWGTVNTCASITNQAFINGSSPEVAQLSNSVIMHPICGTSTNTPTFTPTATITSTIFGGTATFTATFTATPTVTMTYTTPGGTNTFTPTFTSTVTITSTISGGTATNMPTATITATSTIVSGGGSVSIISAVSSQGSCYVAGQNLTVTINASIVTPWANMYGLVIGSPGALTYNNDAGEPDDCLWGLTGTAGNSPSSISPWNSTADIAAGGASGATATNYQMIVPVPASYAGAGPKTFYVVIGNSSTVLTLGEYYSTSFMEVSIVLPECSSGTATFTTTFTPTPTLTVVTPGASGTATMTQTITPTPNPIGTPAGNVTIVSAVSPGGNCYVAGQNLTLTVNAKNPTAWANLYALVVASSGVLDYSNNSGVADSCLWGLTGATGNAPSNTPPWISQASIATGSASGASVSNYQIVVPVPASFASSGPKTFYVIAGNSSTTLQLGQYFTTGYDWQSVTLNECGAGTATYTPTATPTATITLTVNATPSPTCNMAATPVFSVKATYNNGHGANNTVVIDVTSNSDFTAPPVVVVHPYGESPSKPALTLTTVKFPGPPAFYRVIMPQQDGYGDIQSIVVTGTDTCGRYGASNGTYTKVSLTGGRNCWPYHNVINPDRHERCRIVYNVYGPDTVHIRVYSRSGSMVQNICTCVEDGLKKQDETSWYGVNDGNRAVDSGIYYVIIETSFYTERVKIAVVR